MYRCIVYDDKQYHLLYRNIAQPCTLMKPSRFTPSTLTHVKHIHEYSVFRMYALYTLMKCSLSKFLFTTTSDVKNIHSVVSVRNILIPLSHLTFPASHRAPGGPGLLLSLMPGTCFYESGNDNVLCPHACMCVTLALKCRACLYTGLS